MPPALRELRVLRAKPGPRTPIRGVAAPAYSLRPSPPSLLRISVPSASNQRFKTGWCWEATAPYPFPFVTFVPFVVPKPGPLRRGKKRPAGGFADIKEWRGYNLVVGLWWQQSSGAKELCVLMSAMLAWPAHCRADLERFQSSLV